LNVQRLKLTDFICAKINRAQRK